MSYKITERVSKLIIPYLEEHNLRIYDILYIKEGSSKFLRIFIDKKDGYVSIEDCENVSRYVSDLLDKDDIIEESYILEVSSPGIERQLKYDWHYNEAVGKKVEVKLFNKINNMKSIVGELVSGSEKGEVVIKNKEIIKLNRTNIAEVKIFFEFGGFKNE